MDITILTMWRNPFRQKDKKTILHLKHVISMNVQIAEKHLRNHKKPVGKLINRRPPRRGYQKKLKAYLQWAILAQKLIKNHKGR